MGDPASDAALLAQIRAGDGPAARRFYERHADRVYRTAYRLLRDRSASEEVTQDVFVRALGSLGQLRDPDTVAAWLGAITVRAAYDALRAQRRHRDRHLPLAEAGDAGGHTPSVEPLLADHLREAIGRLSRKLQAVLVMYEIEGYSHAEIASALGIPVATSKTRLSQARAQLREDLAPYARPENAHD